MKKKEINKHTVSEAFKAAAKHARGWVKHATSSCETTYRCSDTGYD